MKRTKELLFVSCDGSTLHFLSKSGLRCVKQLIWTCLIWAAHLTSTMVAQDVMENLVPVLLDAHVKGNPRVLRKWMGEAVYNKLNAEITQRKAEGIQLDENILAIEEANIVNVSYEEGTGQSPIIVLQFMVQQIHCIRKNGEIVEVFNQTVMLCRCLTP